MDSFKAEDARKLEILCGKRSKALNGVTTTRYNQLDHILLDKKMFPEFLTTSFRNHTSDHHTIVIRIPQFGNAFSDSFMQKINFDSGQWTKNSSRKRNNFDKSEVPVKTQKVVEELSLKCLLSPNWLTEELIDTYMKLLQDIDAKYMMFETSFCKDLNQVGFENISVQYKDMKIISSKKVFIPVFEESYCFLVTADKTELNLMDPFHFPDVLEERRKDVSMEYHQNHLQFLRRLKDLYFKPLYESYNKPCPEFQVSVLMPPLLPSLANEYDCGVLLLMFAKNLVHSQDFNIDKNSVIQTRKLIQSEILSKKISKINILTDVKVQRTSSVSKKHAAKRRKIVAPNENLHRTFKNLDFESCWINSCLQLVLTAIDHIETGSPLWEHLIWLIKKGKSSSLDPLPIRDHIISKEKQRIVQENITPINRLFDLGQNDNFEEENLFLSPGSQRRSRLGQQDSKDFFVCLAENKEHWLDVYLLFMANSVNSTTCSSCNNVSTPHQGISDNIFFVLDCPREDLSMSYLIDKKMNGYETVSNWRDEDGCNKIANGENKTRLQDIDNVKFVIFVLSRLIEVDGHMQIISTKVPIGGSVLLQDEKKRFGVFKPIALIHHSGLVMGNTTRGHYQTDVLNSITGNWIRTSDDELPVEITEKNVSNQGYIFLYKKISQ